MINCEIKKIPNWFGYYADTNGDIWSKRNRYGLKNELHKLQASKSNYLGVILYKDGKRTRVNVHRLILLTFIGPCPEGMEACHNNGNRFDNKPCNLRWDTRKNNHKDAIRQGTHTGLKATYKKLSSMQIRIIKKYPKYFGYTRDLANIFKVTPQHISKLRLNKVGLTILRNES